MESQTKKPTVEWAVIEEFKRKTQHLRFLQVSTPMEREIVRLATPFHQKLKEMGYTAQESKMMLKNAFDHKPPPASKWLPRKELTVFN